MLNKKARSILFQSYVSFLQKWKQNFAAFNIYNLNRLSTICDENENVLFNKRVFCSSFEKKKGFSVLNNKNRKKIDFCIGRNRKPFHWIFSSLERNTSNEIPCKNNEKLIEKKSMAIYKTENKNNINISLAEIVKPKLPL